MPLSMVGITGDTKTSTAAASTTAAMSTHTTQLCAPSSPSSTPASPVETTSALLGCNPSTHVAERVDDRPVYHNALLYGPHTSTIRMNPYVRCVCGNGVPEIRSLKELLSLKNQPAPAEPDTPCLRPTHGPATTWYGPDGRSSTTASAPAATVAVTGLSSFHDDLMNPALMGAVSAGASVDSVTKDDEHALSPTLAFTADSVATPNTFATVVTHEKRIISHLTRRLRSSVKQHQDTPLGRPTETVCSEDGEEAGDDDVLEDVPFGATSDPSADADVGEVPMLPCSTRDKAAVEEGEAHHPGTITTAPPLECSLARPCTPSPMQQRQWCMQASNERIVSSRSSSAVLCALSDAQTAATRHGQPLLPHAHSSSSMLSLSSGHHHHHHALHRHGPPHSPIPAAVLRSCLAPVAKLEESPYHYITRNYIGGTFLYYSTAESKEYFLRLCHRVVAQVRPLLEQETLSPHHGLFPRINAPAYVFGDIHGNFEDLSFFLKRLLLFHDFNLTPANILCLGDYVDRGPFSLECVILLFSLKIMNASKIVMLRGNHEDRVVCGDLQTYGRGCFLGQCQTVFGYMEGMKLFKEVTALFKYLPLAAELVIPSTPNIAFLRSQQTATHPNLYVSQPAVLLHDATPAAEAPASSAKAQDVPLSFSSSSSPYTAPHLLHPGGDVASGESGDNVLSKSPSTLLPPSFPVTTPAAAAADTTSAAIPATAGDRAIADASLARGHPSLHEAHEERILCAHGGIPRFDRPPLEDNALSALRSLAFPRMLTLFPNNPMAKDDPECAPDHFAQKELPALWRRYPSMAPPEFTAASRREAVEAAAAVGSTTGPLVAAHSAKSRKLISSSSSASYPSVNGQDEGRASSSSSASSASSNSHTQSDMTSALQAGMPLLHRCRSRDMLPQPTDEEVRKAWYTTFDLLWSDPTSMELEEECAGVRGSAAGAAPASRTHINEWGFGINTRGNNVVSFSAKAVDTFLTAHNYSMLFRAHQEKAHGLRWSKSSKVLTIFSTSNYMGHGNGAGCVVVAANGEVQMVEKVCM
ncbi:serine/threonine protein phosphatase-like protein [Leptomonas pyrrhocoris]|uniref:protein-serine/threonine phosphatase n=1 Tax=Leptomonas pyrrhocoris TaxID=157538 RepID=A0A0N0DR55_LEPPY|nr:serine/threonine protein phosphatase-like protein [Leptomonas pyrrhocoris]KPA74162.1 serine/threonine protein phosphatase-like protein [Leptomonas pyrrhocoris]|eukprot:XP_015652601.1 serine/threonine protein phosphatase-like protein [Leptomonas pyrrhocoris]